MIRVTIEVDVDNYVHDSHQIYVVERTDSTSGVALDMLLKQARARAAAAMDAEPPS